jgi:hypothetical protein
MQKFMLPDLKYCNLTKKVKIVQCLHEKTKWYKIMAYQRTVKPVHLLVLRYENRWWP